MIRDAAIRNCLDNWQTRNHSSFDPVSRSFIKFLNLKLRHLRYEYPIDLNRIKTKEDLYITTFRKVIK